MLVHPVFKKVVEESLDLDPYYLKKYEYLKSHNFFSNKTLIDFATIDETVVEDNIAQIQQVVFETTDFCNLDCSYCSFGDFYEGFDPRNQKNIDVEKAITLLKFIFNLKPKNKKNKLFIGFYGGEPLFNEKFLKKIVEVVKELNAGNALDVEFNITTNATLLHKYINFLIENNFQVLISLDGNETNHSYRFYKKNKKNSFKRVIENIDMVQRDYPEYFDKNIRFNAVLHDRNSIKEIYEFIYRRYNKIPRISELSPTDVSVNSEERYKRMFQNKKISETEYLKEEDNLLPHEELLQYSELIDFLKYYSINYYISNILDLMPGEKKYVPTSTCLPFWKKIMLTTTDKLTPCEKVNYHKYFMGEVNANVEINIPEITRKYNSYYQFVSKKCQNCYVNQFCSVCLFLLRKSNLDQIDTAEFECEEFHDPKDFQFKLHRIISFLEKYPKDFSQIIENVLVI